MAPPEPSPIFDLSVRRDLTPTEIVDVFALGDRNYDELTHYTSWPQEHCID